MRYLALLLILAASGWTQTPPPLRLNLPPAEAQAAFLARLENWGRYVDPQKVAIPYASAPALKPTEFGLSPAELVALLDISRAFRASIDAVNADIVKQRGTVGGLAPVLARREQTIDAAMTQVRTALSADAWTRLSAYLQKNYTVTVNR